MFKVGIAPLSLIQDKVPFSAVSSVVVTERAKAVGAGVAGVKAGSLNVVVYWVVRACRATGSVTTATTCSSAVARY